MEKLKVAARCCAATVTVISFLWALMFALSNGKYSYSYWSAYSNDDFSKSAYEYYKGAVSSLKADFADAPEIKWVKVAYDHRSDISFQIVYEMKGEEYDMSVTPHPEDIGITDAWIEFSPAIHVRVSSSSHEDYGQVLLTNYAIDTKKIIDIAVSSVRSHIKDRNEWSDVFTKSDEPNTKQEKSS